MERLSVRLSVPSIDSGNEAPAFAADIDQWLLSAVLQASALSSKCG